MGRTTGDIEVHRYEGVRTIVDFRVVDVRSAGDGARAHCDHNFWRGHRFVSLGEREPHVSRNTPCNQKAVGMTWRRYKLNAEAAEIEHYGVQDVHVRLTCITTTRAHLAQPQRPAEQLPNAFVECRSHLQH